MPWRPVYHAHNVAVYGCWVPTHIPGGAFSRLWKSVFKVPQNSVTLTHLVFVSGEAAALHGAGVEVALVVELEARQARVQFVQDGRQAAAEGQQLSAGAVEADAHGALQGDAAAVAQQ